MSLEHHTHVTSFFRIFVTLVSVTVPSGNFPNPPSTEREMLLSNSTVVALKTRTTARFTRYNGTLLNIKEKTGTHTHGKAKSSIRFFKNTFM